MFEDLIKLDIPSYIINVFIIENNELISYSTDIQKVYDIKYNEELTIIFRTDDYTSFWLKNATKYPNIWKDIKLYLLAFPTSYLVEKGNYNMYHIICTLYLAFYSRG